MLKPAQEGIGEFIAQSKQNADALKSLRSEFTSGFDDLRKSIERMGERLSVATRPNFSTIIGVCSVMLTGISIVGGIIGFFLWHAIESQTVATKDLDTKLQREFQLSIQTATQAVDNVNSRSIERHETAIKEIHQLGERQDWQIRSDLEELRQRRMKDVIK